MTWSAVTNVALADFSATGLQQLPRRAHGMEEAMAVTKSDFVEIGRRYGVSAQQAAALFDDYVKARKKIEAKGGQGELTRADVEFIMKNQGRLTDEKSYTEADFVEMGRIVGASEEQAKEAFRTRRKERRGAFSKLFRK